MNYVKTITLSTVAILAISGCGSSDDSDGGAATPPAAKNITINGAAVDGYLHGATVCLDLNSDGLCAIGTEPATSTAADGSYSLTLTPAEQAAASSSVSLLVYGGIDMDTGEWFGGRLRAPLGSGVVNITPLTSMVQSVVANGGTVEAAEQQVADALGLAVGQVNADPVSLYATAPEVMTATLTVQRVVEVLASAAIAAGNTESEAAVMEAIYADLGAAIVAVAADETVEGMADIVTKAATTSANIDGEVAVVASVIEGEVTSTIQATSNLSDAALLIDASSEAVEEAVVAAVDADNTGTLADDAQTAASNAETDLEKLAIANLFQTYDVAVTDAQIAEIATALTTAASVTAIVGLDLSSSTIATPAVVAALQNAYNSAQLVLKKDEIVIYLTSFGATTQSDATLEAIAGLSGFSNTMTEAVFVTLLRTTSNANLLALAEVLDPTAPPVTGSESEWFNGKELYSIWFEGDENGAIVLKSKIVLNGGNLSFNLSEYNQTAKSWTTNSLDDGDEYELDTTTGAWVADDYSAISYVITADTSVMQIEGDNVKIASVTDISGQTHTINEELDLNVTFGAGAKRYNLESKDNESYSLEYPLTQWTDMGDSGIEFGTLEAYLASGSTGIYWNDSTNIGVSFQINPAVTDSYGAVDADGNLITTVTASTHGNLVINDNNAGTITVVGTWDVGSLPGQSTLTILTHLDAAHSALVDKDGEVLITVYNSKVYVGMHQVAMSDYKADDSDINYNLNAMEDIEDAIAAFTFPSATSTTTPPVAEAASLVGEWAAVGSTDDSYTNFTFDNNGIYIQSQEGCDADDSNQQRTEIGTYTQTGNILNITGHIQNGCGGFDDEDNSSIPYPGDLHIEFSEDGNSFVFTDFGMSVERVSATESPSLVGEWAAVGSTDDSYTHFTFDNNGIYVQTQEGCDVDDPNQQPTEIGTYTQTGNILNITSHIQNGCGGFDDEDNSSIPYPGDLHLEFSEDGDSFVFTDFNVSVTRMGL